MLHYFRSTRFAKLMLASCAFLMLIQPTQAAVVSSADLIQEQQAQIDRQTLLNALQRSEVQEILTSKGVDPQLAQQRVASMTDEEVRTMNAKINELPAGSGVLGTILLVLVILVLTDLAGWTDVYPGIN